MNTNRGNQIVSSIEDELDARAVNMFRCFLAKSDLLPASQDNYHIMLRFLKATRSSRDPSYDYVKAECYWKKMINWRRTNGVDTIIQDFVYKEQEDVRLYFPHGFHGVDKAGRPVYIRYCNKIDCVELMKVTTEDRFVKSFIQECEKMVLEKFPACSEIANKHIDSVVYILVLPPSLNESFKAIMLTDMLTTRLGEIHSYYYPETVHQIFYINAGIGTKLLNKLRNWGRDPRKKLVGSYALGKDYLPKLLEYIDEDQLPTFLGGSCSCPGKEGGCLRFEKGPWEVSQAKDKVPEMAVKKREEIPEKMKIIPSSSPEIIQARNGMGSALSRETGCEKCTELEKNFNLLSRKLDKVQTTLNLLLSAQDRTNFSGVSREPSRQRNYSENWLVPSEDRASYSENWLVPSEDRANCGRASRKLKKP